jgi:hypothetical protein
MAAIATDDIYCVRLIDIGGDATTMCSYHVCCTIDILYIIFRRKKWYAIQ